MNRKIIKFDVKMWLKSRELFCGLFLCLMLDFSNCKFKIILKLLVNLIIFILVATYDVP